MIILDYRFLVRSTKSSLSTAEKFAYITRLRKGEKSFKTNVAHLHTWWVLHHQAGGNSVSKRIKN
jgi:hypothetical protein